MCLLKVMTCLPTNTRFLTNLELSTEKNHWTENYYSGARGPPQFSKKRSENEGANENLSCGFSSILGIAPGVAPRIAVCVLLKS